MDAVGNFAMYYPDIITSAFVLGLITGLAVTGRYDFALMIATLSVLPLVATVFFLWCLAPPLAKIGARRCYRRCSRSEQLEDIQEVEAPPPGRRNRRRFD